MITFADFFHSRYYSLVMLDRSIEYLDPYLIAERGRLYKGTIPLCQLERLSESLHDSQGVVRYSLRFAKEDKIHSVSGKVQAELLLECSVCLEKIAIPVDSDVKLGIVSTLAEAERLPEVFEPLLVVDRQIQIKNIVEDELLLAIPIIPRHLDCSLRYVVDQPASQKTTNPFSILADLKSPGEQ